MKWVKIREGYHKYVEDSDDRPAVILKNKKGIPYIKTSIPWASTEKYITIGDPEKERQAADIFDSERKEWTKTSLKLRRWEEDRKKSWAKDKPAWRKEQMKKDPLGFR